MHLFSSLRECELCVGVVCTCVRVSACTSRQQEPGPAELRPTWGPPFLLNGETPTVIMITKAVPSALLTPRLHFPLPVTFRAGLRARSRSHSCNSQRHLKSKHLAFLMAALPEIQSHPQELRGDPCPFPHLLSADLIFFPPAFFPWQARLAPPQLHGHLDR